MKRIQNDCVDCGLPCIGDACRYRNVPYYYCDKCGCEIYHDELYVVDGEDLCEDCLKEMFKC